MEPNEAKLILDAIASVRQEQQDVRSELMLWRLEMEKRLTTLEVESKDISGNGQPGRMQKAEEMVRSMTVRFGYLAGAAATIGAAAGLLGWLFPRH